jgi:predicted nucleic acid-binding protein
MTDAVVIDTMIAGWLFSRAKQIDPYRLHVTGRPIVVSFVTVAEIRYGAIKANWGNRRRQDAESQFAAMQVVRPDNDLVNVYARMRAECARSGHGLHGKDHEADRWIAATAIRYGFPLISHDKIFANVPDLVHVREA